MSMSSIRAEGTRRVLVSTATATAAGVTSCLVLIGVLPYLRRDRWAVVRTHKWRWARQLYKTLSVYHFAWKLDRAYKSLLPTTPGVVPLQDDLGVHPRAAALLEQICADGPHTFQQKPTNRAQIESLVGCVCELIHHLQQRRQHRQQQIQQINEHQTQKSEQSRLMVLDLGAGKALFTRTVYEAMHRTVVCCAVDSRPGHKYDKFYDPPPPADTTCIPRDQNGDDEAAYKRVVANVCRLSSQRTVDTLMGETTTTTPTTTTSKKGQQQQQHHRHHHQSPNSVVAVTKHLCGGATDSSLMSLCSSPLHTYIGACCLAPCCHQKLKRDQYCNVPYLESLGFCQTHVGLRGETLDADFRTLGLLISMSKHPPTTKELRSFEYKNKNLLRVLGYARTRDLGRKARHILEEGRMQYLRAHGFDARLVRYCDESITGDNLAIIARKKEVAAT